MKILVIDDDSQFLDAITDFLAMDGHEVHPWINAMDAVDITKRREEDGQPYDLVICDYDMGGVSGLDVAKGFQFLKLKTPLIVWSGDMSEQRRELLKASNVLYALNKPTTKDQLTEFFDLLRDAQILRKGG